MKINTVFLGHNVTNVIQMINPFRPWEIADNSYFKTHNPLFEFNIFSIKSVNILFHVEEIRNIFNFSRILYYTNARPSKTIHEFVRTLIIIVVPVHYLHCFTLLMRLEIIRNSYIGFSTVFGRVYTSLRPHRTTAFYMLHTSRILQIISRVSREFFK